MKAFDDDGTELVECEHCYGRGEWEAECCNGSYGCSCRGEVVPMGQCNVCCGQGWRRPDANTKANCDAIAGMPYLGSGPRR